MPWTCALATNSGPGGYTAEISLIALNFINGWDRICSEAPLVTPDEHVKPGTEAESALFAELDEPARAVRKDGGGDAFGHEEDSFAIGLEFRDHRLDFVEIGFVRDDKLELVRICGDEPAEHFGL